MERANASTRSDSADIAVGAKVSFLGRSDTYAEGTTDVEVVETHMSWVFLTDRFAYKLKKPVRYDFLDFRSIEARRRNCEEEVRLNRRLAPTVYLGIVPLTANKDGELSLGDDGTPVDWLVKMHRLPRDRMLDQAIARGSVGLPQFRSVALLLAAFYRDAEPVDMSGQAYRRGLTAEIASNRRHLGEPLYGLPDELINSACDAQSHFVASHPEVFDRRASDRRVIEAHGDLRPEHICLGPPPQIIDCLEFKRAFRILDPADELSFLALECERLGAHHLGSLAFDIYRETTGDEPPESLICFHKSFRACMRAKISAWHLREADIRTPRKWVELSRTYLELAEHYARRIA